jgi:hypothetical protein
MGFVLFFFVFFLVSFICVKLILVSVKTGEKREEKLIDAF